MRANKELLLDVINNKKKELEIFVEELDGSSEMVDETKVFLYEYDLIKKKEMIELLENLIEYVKSCPASGVDSLKKYIKENSVEEDSKVISIRVSKYKIVKELIKAYKAEYKKNYWNNKYAGLTGAFDNELFCSVIKEKINKYVYCNKVTRAKYKHLTAFLNEFLHEMENAEDPLKMLVQKMKLYKKYKKTEYVEIRKEKISKIDVIKEILEDYKKEKSKSTKM